MKRFHGQDFFNVQPAEQYGHCFVKFVWGQLFEHSEQLYFYRRIHPADLAPRALQWCDHRQKQGFGRDPLQREEDVSPALRQSFSGSAPLSAAIELAPVVIS